MALLQNNIFNWLLSLPCNLKFSKLREYDSVVSAKVKPILRTSEQPRNVILPGKKFSKSLTRRVAHLYIFLTDGSTSLIVGCSSNLTDTECSMRTRYRNQRKLLYRHRYIAR